jgi:tRNA threonylcarbamoyladenosine biosynthesis protein TsaE
LQHITSSEKDTQKLGTTFGENCKGGEVFLLSGELGGGKTQFVKGLALGLGITDDITSPTFTYEKIYQGKKLTLYHFDLYREEVLDPDIRALMEEAFSDNRGVTAVEWSERMGGFKPASSTGVFFKWKSENEREIEINDQ